MLNNGTALVVISCDVPSHTLPSLCEGALLFGKDKVGEGRGSPREPARAFQPSQPRGTEIEATLRQTPQVTEWPSAEAHLVCLSA